MSAHLNNRRPSRPPCARFAVVLNPGTLFETVEVYAQSLVEAEAWAADSRELSGGDVEVMRIKADGSLTREIFSQ